MEVLKRYFTLFKYLAFIIWGGNKSRFIAFLALLISSFILLRNGVDFLALLSAAFSILLAFQLVSNLDRLSQSRFSDIHLISNFELMSIKYWSFFLMASIGFILLQYLKLNLLIEYSSMVPVQSVALKGLKDTLILGNIFILISSISLVLIIPSHKFLPKLLVLSLVIGIIRFIYAFIVPFGLLQGLLTIFIFIFFCLKLKRLHNARI